MKEDIAVLRALAHKYIDAEEFCIATRLLNLIEEISYMADKEEGTDRPVEAY